MADQGIDNQNSNIGTQVNNNSTFDEEKLLRGVATLYEKIHKTNSNNPKSEEEEIDKETDNSKFFQGKDFNLTDHLVELPDDTSSSYFFSQEIMPLEALRNAIENRILLLSCPIEGLLHTAIYTTINKVEEESGLFSSKKYIEVRSIDLEYSVTPSINWFTEENIEENQIYVLDINFTGLTSLFIDSMSQIMRDYARNFLRKKNSLLLVKVDRRQFKPEIFEDLSNYIWEVPFLASYLKRKGYDDLIMKITEQRKSKKWAQSESKFYHELYNAIIDGTLRIDCEKRDKITAELVVENDIKEKKHSIWKLLEKKKKPLRRYLIFIIAFFEGVNDDDLDVILKGLTEDDKKLKKAYKEGYGTILKDCFIQRISNGELDYIDLTLDFTDPDFREQAIEYFFLEDFYFLREQCNTLLKKGFLLQRRPSFSSYRNLIILIGSISKASSGYGLKLLKHLIAAIVSIKSSIDLSIPDFKIDDLFNENLYESDLEYKALIESVNPVITFNILLKSRRSGYGVLAEVIQEMSKHGRLEQDLRQFFHFLISNKQHVAAFEVIRILRYSTKLDKIGWLRQLIDGGETNIKIKAFQYLITLAPHNSIHLAEYLQNIYEWLPDRTNPDTYSPANKFALKFILEFSNFSFWRLKMSDEEIGSYPSSYPLFQLMNDIENGDVWLAKILDWLTHEGIEYAWHDGTEDVANTKRRYYFSVANLLENWHAILHGLSREPLASENMELFERILDSFIQIAMKDRTIYQSLVKNWVGTGTHYERKMRKAIRQSQESETDHDRKAADKDKMEYAARRYLLIQKFLPAVKQKVSMYPAQF